MGQQAHINSAAPGHISQNPATSEQIIEWSKTTQQTAQQMAHHLPNILKQLEELKEYKKDSDKRILELENKVSKMQRKCDGCQKNHNEDDVKLFSPECIGKKCSKIKTSVEDTYKTGFDEEFGRLTAQA